MTLMMMALCEVIPNQIVHMTLWFGTTRRPFAVSESIHPGIDLTQIRHVMEGQFSDAMTVTRCLTLPDLRDPEEMAMFTFSRLLNPIANSKQQRQANYFLASINTFSTPGASTLQATFSLCTTLKPSVVYYKKIARIGPRHKRLGSLVPHYPSPAQHSHTSCVCLVTKPYHPITFRDRS